MINLFKSTAEVKTYYQMLSKNVDFTEISNSLEQVTALFVTPYLGKQLLENIDADQNNIAKQSVINALKTAIVNYFVFQELPNRTYFFSSSGAKQSDNDKTNNLSISDIKFRQNHALKQADAFLDIALNEIAATPSVFSTFAPTQKQGSIFFTTAQELTDIINIQGFRAFILLSRFLRQVENNELTAICGDTFLSSIRQNTDSRAKKVVILIQNFVAYKALFLAIPNMLFVVEGDGLKVYSSSDGFDKREHIQKIHIDSLNALSQSAEKNATHFQRLLIAYLKTNQTFFTDYDDYITALTPTETTPPELIQSGTTAIIF